MQIHFLGTNGWFNTPLAETVCVAIDSADAYVVFDAGQGLRKLNRVVTDLKKPIYLFLSHFHLDHVYGFHTLPLLHCPQGIQVFGQPGTTQHIQTLVNSPWTGALQKSCIRGVHDVEAGTHDTPFPCTALPLLHSDPCFGYRMTLEGKTIAFCTDTGRCENLVTLGTDADVLITECSWKVRNQMPQWPHLAPEDAAEMAQAARAKQLALIHFEANAYATRADRDDAEARARAIFPNARAMHDDDIMTL